MTDPSGYAKCSQCRRASTRVRGINAGLDLSARPATARGRPVRSPSRRDYVDLVRHECEFRDGKSFPFCVEAEAAAISAARPAELAASSSVDPAIVSSTGTD